MSGPGFSGSYQPEDVTFLLKPIELPPTELAERERRIQSGLAHYSEMIGREEPPSARYLALFRQAMRLGGARLARGLAEMASLIAASRSGPLTLVSLARAGTPVGVLLGRILRQYFQRPAEHYSVSIIRDRGLDLAALRHILAAHPAESVVFIDGWTAKGVIARELGSAIEAFKTAATAGLSSNLYVLTDLRGEEGVLAPTAEDYLIPSCLLNAVVSGLISRSILNRDCLGPDDFHGCLYYQELAEQDLSQWFVDESLAAVEDLNRIRPLTDIQARAVSAEEKLRLRVNSAKFLDLMRHRYQIPHENFIKPGLGEATRVLLRREPDRLLVRSDQEPEMEPILLLAQEKNVPVILERALPFKAAALIRRIDHD